MNVVIIGAGGHAKVIADLCIAANRHVIGVVASEQHPDLDRMGIAYLGNDEILTDDFVVRDVSFSVAIGNQDSRRIISEELISKGANMARLVHPSAAVSSFADIGAGVQVMAQAAINPTAKLGQGCIVNTGAIIEHDVRLGDWTQISPGAVLTGNVTCGEMAEIGAGATVLPGVHIGTRSIVGAGAVVVDDVRDGATVVGVPAKIRGAAC